MVERRNCRTTAGIKVAFAAVIDQICALSAHNAGLDCREAAAKNMAHGGEAPVMGMCWSKFSIRRVFEARFLNITEI
jgi:hypothetical protein